MGYPGARYPEMIDVNIYWPNSEGPEVENALERIRKIAQTQVFHWDRLIDEALKAHEEPRNDIVRDAMLTLREVRDGERGHDWIELKELFETEARHLERELGAIEDRIVLDGEWRLW